MAESSRSAARFKALQALYQWDLSQASGASIIRQFQETQNMHRVDQQFFGDLVRGVSQTVAVLDAQFGEYLDRPVTQLDPIERSVLRMGVWQLQYMPELPYRVVINESVELTKKFGAEQAHKYVNGVLDRVAKALRPDEVRMRSSS